MLSQSVGYAAAALGCVAAMGGKPVLIKDAARLSGVPAAYLAKIINTLARRKLVRTQRGQGGGVTLARPAQGLTLLDLCVALEDPALEPRCLLGADRCSDDRACPAHGYCKDFRARQREFLVHTTVADIAQFEARRRWTPARPAERAARRERR